MSFVKNRDVLLSGREAELRRVALDIVDAAIAHSNPGIALRKLLSFDGQTLRVGDCAHALKPDQRIFVIGAGKATYPIAEALEGILGSRIFKGLIICKSGQTGSLARVGIHHASHPIPDENSLAGAEQMLALIEEVRAGDIVFACFTGGSSALFVKPIEGISLADKALTNQILLTCGANIIEINAVRKRLSQVKGGQVARMLPAGSKLINLTVSDVIGDYLDYITDPTVPDTSGYANARATLDKYRLWDRLPKSVTIFLKQAHDEGSIVKEADLSHIERTDVILVKADAACTGAANAARRSGFAPMILSTLFEGDSSALGRNFAAIAKQVLLDGNPVSAPCVLIGGGETTVVVGANGGQGGPNQEFAVSAALELADVPGIIAIGIDTDGTDGPTDLAGGLADSTTLAAATAQGVDLRKALDDHNVSVALKQSGHAIVTGATGTNVNDLKLVLITPPDAKRVAAE